MHSWGSYLWDNSTTFQVALEIVLQKSCKGCSWDKLLRHFVISFASSARSALLGTSEARQL